MARSRTARRPARQQPGALEQKLDESLQRLVYDWLRLTWVSDTQRVVWLPISLWNWLLLAGVVAGWAVAWRTAWLPLSVVTVAAFVVSGLRSAVVMPKRRKVVADLFSRAQGPAKLQSGTLANPTDPATYIKVRRWARKQLPVRYTVTVSPDSPAATSLGRVQLETALETGPHQHVARQGGLCFAWSANAVQAESVPADDTRLAQLQQQRWVARVLAELFKVTNRRGDSDASQVQLQIPEWSWQHDAAGTPKPTPGRIVFVHPTLSAVKHDWVEREFDRQLKRPETEWLYEWRLGEQTLVITTCARESLPARRKQEARQITDLLNTVAPKGSEPVTVDVDRWLPDDSGMAHLPHAVTADFGSRDLGSQASRARVEQRLDEALGPKYQDKLVFVYEWEHGASTRMTMTGYLPDSLPAQQRLISKRLWSVANSKFGGRRDSDNATVEVLEWDTLTDDSGRSTALASKVRIHFGGTDVTRPETRFNFESHWDSQISTNDWNYKWVTADGYVDTTAVPSLPDYVPFPEEGSEEAQRWQEDFRRGLITLGPAKGGGYVTVNLNDTPHTLFGGTTGRGKSVMLALVLYGSLSNPDLIELIVVDPKVTDFTWTPGYPNVRKYAVDNVRTSVEEIHQIIKYAFEQMNDRQQLLKTYKRENLQQLREAAREGDIDLAPEDVPKRLIVFFDELGDAFTPSKDKDLKALQDEARSWLERIGMLGRAMEVNIVGAAQKPGNDNVGTAVREQLGNTVAMGWLRFNVSQQVLGNDLANKALDPEESPLGRGIACLPGQKDSILHGYFLPQRNTQNRYDPTIIIEGLQERVAKQLAKQGWSAVDVSRTFTVLDGDGNPIEKTVTSTEWIHPDRID